MFNTNRCRHAGRLALAAGLLLPAAATAQLRVAAWNISNYAGGRTADLQTAIYATFEGRSLTPDLILCQEFTSAAALAEFTTILNSAPDSPGDWAAAPFIDGPDTDSACVYRTGKLTYLATTLVAPGGTAPAPPRNILRFDLRLHGYTAPATTLAGYSTHMKSGTASSDQSRRLLEAQYIRADAAALNPDWHFFIGGDFNIQSSTQAAYQELVGTETGPAGRFYDPIATPGGWNNNCAFRFVHTQDPIGPGGVDDRHDQLLLSSGLVDGDGFDYLGHPTVPYSTTTWDDANHSYRAWGNDGTSCNLTLTVAGNTMVGPAIAQALINVANGAGHLPVFLDLRVPPQVDSEPGAAGVLDFGQVPQGAPAEQTLLVWNAGDTALWSAQGIAELAYTLSASTGFTAPGGTFVATAGGGAAAHTITMDTATVGPHSGTLLIAANAPDEPSRTVALTGTVLAPDNDRPGDLNCDGSVNFRDINPFVLALTSPDLWQAEFPGCPLANADTSGDGSVNFRDINPFVALLTR